MERESIQPRSSLATLAICSVATVLLLIATTGARRPAQPVNSGPPPWPAPSAAAVDAGVRAAGLPLLSTPDVVTRYAVHLDVRVNGAAVQVPRGIGVHWRSRAVAPLYTSDDTGIVHVRSDATAPVFRIGQFFDEWQVPLRNATVYVDGVRQHGAPGDVVLVPHQEITMSFGGLAAQVPVRYSFPAGT